MYPLASSTVSGRAARRARWISPGVGEDPPHLFGGAAVVNRGRGRRRDSLRVGRDLWFLTP